ncbi:5-oxoprolinase subunit PxpA [Aquamicrobium sp. LC103]|uniref:LamB/YcsF family protein n=1 Tax=Aquamicrobium sp. LC103 TaxID=1120658 RepID=UPI00063EC0F8|nr:5-oxoprolinase subunit PxpA [Aquamicrobium sp. LC103]TKT76242.1 5-oxoprolinase subunit PxpA [Aquamicrobium sp. LC103]
MTTIDLNSDLGEGFGPYRIADDRALLDMVSSANIACGAHAGDPLVMDETVRLATQRGVIVGAHIGYADREGFGRRAINLSLKELELLTLTQLGALSAIARNAGARLTHANFHGALGNLSFVDRDVARTLLGVVKSFDPALKFVGLPHTEAAREAEAQGIELVRSFLADRAYTPEGILVSRQIAGSVIKDLAMVRRRVMRVLQEGVVEAIDGTLVPMQTDSILIHSDTSGAVELAGAIRSAVLDCGYRVAPF